MTPRRRCQRRFQTEELKAFSDRHGISRDELMSRMGGSP